MVHAFYRHTLHMYKRERSLQLCVHCCRRYIISSPNPRVYNIVILLYSCISNNSTALYSVYIYMVVPPSRIILCAYPYLPIPPIYIYANGGHVNGRDARPPDTWSRSARIIINCVFRSTISKKHFHRTRSMRVVCVTMTLSPKSPYAQKINISYQYNI